MCSSSSGSIGASSVTGVPPQEQLDVAAQRALLVDDPAAQRRIGRLQRRDDRAGRGAVDLDDAEPAGVLADGTGQDHPRHQASALVQCALLRLIGCFAPS